MGADDEVAVVFNNEDQKWYVSIVGGGNIKYAIRRGQCFTTKTDALDYATNLSSRKYTEYGIRIYEGDEF